MEAIKFELKVRDRVTIINANGRPVAEGTIINVNDYREPSQKYAVDVDGYTDDVLFFGESQLQKPPYTLEEYEEANKQNLDLDDWNNYSTYFGLGEEQNYDDM